MFSACGTGEFWSVIWRNGLFMWNLKAWGEEVRGVYGDDRAWVQLPHSTLVCATHSLHPYLHLLPVVRTCALGSRDALSARR